MRALVTAHTMTTTDNKVNFCLVELVFSGKKLNSMKKTYELFKNLQPHFFFNEYGCYGKYVDNVLKTRETILKRIVCILVRPIEEKLIRFFHFSPTGVSENRK